MDAAPTAANERIDIALLNTLRIFAAFGASAVPSRRRSALTGARYAARVLALDEGLRTTEVSTVSLFLYSGGRVAQR